MGPDGGSVKVSCKQGQPIFRTQYVGSVGSVQPFLMGVYGGRIDTIFYSRLAGSK